MDDTQEMPAEMPPETPGVAAPETAPESVQNSAQPKQTPAVAPDATIQQPGVDPLTEAVAKPNTPLESTNAIASAENQQSLRREADANTRAQKAHSGIQKILDDNEQSKQIQMVPVLQKYQQDQEDLVKKFQGELQTQSLKYKDAVDDLTNYNPNPWADRGTGFAIGSAIAIGLNQMGIAFGGGQGSNVALKMLDDSLNRDLMRQRLIVEQKKGNVEAQAGLLNHMLTIYKDQGTAIQAAKASAMQLVATRAQMQLMAKKPELRTLDDQKFIATTQAKAEIEYRKLQDATVKNTISIHKAKAQEMEFNATQKFKKDVFASTNPAGLFDELGKSLDNPKRKHLETVFSAMRGEVAPGYKELLESMQGAPSEENFRRFQQATKRLILASKNIYGEGARLTPQLQKIDKALLTGDVGYLRDQFGSEVGRKLALEGFHTLHDKADTELRTGTGQGLDYWSQRYNQKAAQTAGVMGPGTEPSAPGETE